MLKGACECLRVPLPARRRGISIKDGYSFLGGGMEVMQGLGLVGLIVLVVSGWCC